MLASLVSSPVHIVYLYYLLDLTPILVIIEALLIYTVRHAGKLIFDLFCCAFNSLRFTQC